MSKSVRLYDGVVTGKWFVRGKGFTAECMMDATPLDSREVAVVRYSYSTRFSEWSEGRMGSTFCRCNKCENAEVEFEEVART